MKLCGYFALALSVLFFVMLIFPVQGQVNNSTSQIPSLVKEGDEYTVLIEDLAREGDGIARIGDLVVFVANGRVGDQVEIQIDKVMRRFAIGHVLINITSVDIEYNPTIINNSTHNDLTPENSSLFTPDYSPLDGENIHDIGSLTSTIANLTVSNQTTQTSGPSTDSSCGPLAPESTFIGSKAEDLFPFFLTSITMIPEQDDPEKNEAYWLNKGNGFYKSQNYDKALDCYIKAIELDRDNADLWYSKGNALFKEKRYGESLDAYDHATELKPNHSWAWGAKCVILNALKRTSDAKYACSKTGQ